MADHKGTRAVMRQAAAQRWAGVDRRRHTRTVIPPVALGARLFGGIDVVVRNVSSRGMLFESGIRLLVGSPVRLRLRTAAEAWLELAGRVVRCEVAGLPDGRVRYSTALHFDQEYRVTELATLIGVPREAQVAVPASPEPLNPALN